MAKMKAKGAEAVLHPNPVNSFDNKRDAYGFVVRPQHLQRYREYANIYKEEEEERSDRWDDFLDRQTKSVKLSDIGSPIKSDTESTNLTTNDEIETAIVDESVAKKLNHGSLSEENKKIKSAAETKGHRIQIWTEIRPSLHAIEDMMSGRVTQKVDLIKNEPDSFAGKPLPVSEEVKPVNGASEEDSDEEFYDLDRSESESVHDFASNESSPSTAKVTGGSDTHSESQPPWKEELECLVQGGVPMALRGELWQAFVGVRKRRVESYYSNLLASDTNSCGKNTAEDKNLGSNPENEGIREKWKAQIEKDLPRTFPGHPALDEDGRNALRRLLTAYARHNPSVGYCQAMNFFAGLLLLLMPEENAFWTLTGVLDDYFDGYFSEEMLESQVDQLVLEELAREQFPKLINHLDYLGVHLPWVTGLWFLSIFMNMLPWESVLRVWDVLLFQGNRLMLFRTTFSLMELYGPALVTTKDAGDAVTLLQSLACSTFDSSQLVLTACMGYQTVNEIILQELRNKHRPAVTAVLEERSKVSQIWRDSKGLASKLYSFKHVPGSKVVGTGKSSEMNVQINGNASHLDAPSGNGNGLGMNLNGVTGAASATDIKEQVVWLKVELCKLLEEKQSVELRAEELETALMEMVKQDNRRQLSARVEQLERELSELQQAFAGKQEQENAMLQILMRVEQEQKLTEDARRFAEQDASAQRYASQLLQEKYEEATTALADMENRAVMAESMLEATLQYQSGQNKAQPSPRSAHHDSSVVPSNQDIPTRKIRLLSRPFGLGWRDKNKVSEEGKDDKS